MALLGPAWKIVAPFQAKSIAYSVYGQHYCFKATSLDNGEETVVTKRSYMIISAVYALRIVGLMMFSSQQSHV